ncbi:hypothetical protein LXL04_008232 [Taraxacum kok-saghyz]
MDLNRLQDLGTTGIFFLSRELIHEVSTLVQNLILIVCIYVDDHVFIGNSQEMIDKFKEFMKNEFDVTDLGLVHFSLGIEVKQYKSGLFIKKQRYAHNFGLKLSKDSRDNVSDSILYRSLVGSLMYLTITRINLAFSVSSIRKFMETSRNVIRKQEREFLDASRELYIIGYPTKKLMYLTITKTNLAFSVSSIRKFMETSRNVIRKQEREFLDASRELYIIGYPTKKLRSYCDSDFGRNIDEGRGTIGYILHRRDFFDASR